MAGPVLPEGMTEQQFALLSEEERQGALDLAKEERDAMGLGDVEDDDEEQGKDDGQGAGGDDDPAPEPEPKPADAPAPEAAAQPEAKESAPVAAAPAAPAPAATEQQPAKAAAAPSFPAWTAPADIDDQIKAARADKRALRQKYEDGDLTGAEFDAQLEAIDEKIEGLSSTKMKAEMSWETRVNNWVNRDVAGFLGEHTEYKPGSIRYKALNDTLSRLQEALPDNADTLNPDLLRQAHEAVEQELGPAPNAKPKPKVGDDPKNRRPDPPPSLGAIPAADMEETGESEFGFMDKLDGTEFEAALAKMSPAQRERYESGG